MNSTTMAAALVEAINISSKEFKKKFIFDFLSGGTKVAHKQYSPFLFHVCAIEIQLRPPERRFDFVTAWPFL